MLNPALSVVPLLLFLTTGTAQRVKLVRGPNPREGRVEVYYDGRWGIVCDNGFTNAEARVVCYMLGYGHGGKVIGNRYGTGDGTIWLDDVSCSGGETNIAHCRHLGWGRHNCSLHENVAVSCPWVKLVGGPTPQEGRLEVYHSGTWGTVCGDYFNDTAAAVVCYMLGYVYSGKFVGNRYGAGSGRIWLDDVRCNGTETSIADCQHIDWGVHNCEHNDDVSVACTTVRLVGGPSAQEGRLERVYDGRWANVCRDSIDNEVAKVVCSMLGYGHVGHVSGNLHGAGAGRPPNVYGLWCSGTEANIADCRQYKGYKSYCDYVSVTCFTEVKLVGESGSKGRLEVYHNGTWGTVCDNGFTDEAARVVCSMLGYGRTGRFIGNAYGAGSGAIWMDDVQCQGRELHIAHCRHNGWGRHNCSHGDDVSVSCIADSTESLALVGGGDPRVGRLEVFHANQWGTVCDDGFTDAAARVVCYSLGFGYVGRKADVELYGVGNGLIWLNNINCTGTEQYIGECSHSDWRPQSCGHHQDVVVTCMNNTADVNDSTVTPVRLAAGSSSRGRLEVLHDGVWGTICDDLFTAAEVRVACRMLGFGSGRKIDNRNYTGSRGKIWLDNVRCNGTETDIVECSHSGWGVHNCSQHREDVAVSCAATKVEVRLNGGRDPREGRLEVFYNGTWGYVCRDALNYAAAGVVCNMLGYGYIGRPTYTSYGGGPFWLRSVQCSGMEESIAECRHNGWGDTECSHYDSVQFVSCLTNNSVALFGGGSAREGRVEVYHNGTWGTVCDDGFTDAAARVVCYSLGFGYVGREMNITNYGIGEGKIWLDDVQCSGTERYISKCRHGGWDAHNCGHHEDVAVSCVGDSAATSTTSAPPSTSAATSMSSGTSTVSSTTSATTSTRKSTSSLSSTSRSMFTSPPTSSTSPVSSSSSVVASTASTSSPTKTADNSRATIIASIVVGGLVIFVIGIIAYKCFRIIVKSRQTPQRERSEVTMNPISIIASASTDEDDDGAKYANTADTTQLSDSF